MISSSSAQIEATAGLEYTLPNGQPDYGKVSTILIGVGRILDKLIQFAYSFFQVVAGAMILLCLFGPESHAAQYEHGKAAFETGAGNDVLAQEEHVAAHDSEKAENSFIESASDEKHEKH